MIEGSSVIHQALDGCKEILPEEQVTINFAYASVVTISLVKKRGPFTLQNIRVKRSGTGSILADQFNLVLGKKATSDLIYESVAN